MPSANVAVEASICTPPTRKGRNADKVGDAPVASEGVPALPVGGVLVPLQDFDARCAPHRLSAFLDFTVAPLRRSAALPS